LPEGALNTGFGYKKDEANKDSIWNQKGTLRVENRANKEVVPKAGTLNQLVLHFTSPVDGESSKEGERSRSFSFPFFHFTDLSCFFPYVEGEFLRKTLLGLDTFTTPAIFLDKLIERYEGPKQRQLSVFEQNLQAKAQKRVCSTL